MEAKQCGKLRDESEDPSHHGNQRLVEEVKYLSDYKIKYKYYVYLLETIMILTFK